MSGFLRSPFLLIAGAAAALFASSIGLHAHEIGTTRVNVLFQPSGMYNIQITTDAAALVEKLSSAAGEAISSSSNPVELQDRLRRFDEIFRGRLSIMFDGVASRPSIEYVVSRGEGEPATAAASIKLMGEIPAAAREFMWNYSWTFATYALSVQNAGSTQAATEWLEGGQASSPIPVLVALQPVSQTRTAARYLALGFTHIVPNGFDHMLFVLGIFLLTRRARHVLLQVSAFTIAHSITLALSMYDIVSVSPRIVEPLIALSIAYVAIENLLMSELRPWRVALVFAFGLLHGMGFAGALRELGLPRSEFVTALVTFNVGVEAGQLAVIGSAFLLVGWYCGSRSWYRQRIVLPASALIACTAVYWTIERLAS